jgi:S-adenosylmethionine synthetase
VAKHIVEAGLARRVEVQLAYAIGVREPVSVNVDTFGTSAPGVTKQAIMRAIEEVFDLTPAGIIEALDLRKPIYSPTSSYGHFGRTPEHIGNGTSGKTLFSWEETLRVDQLKHAVQQASHNSSSSSQEVAHAAR